jgi:hypothetical protein
MITAYATVVKLAPGKYKIKTVLDFIEKPRCGGRPCLSLAVNKGSGADTEH